MAKKALELAQNVEAAAKEIQNGVGIRTLNGRIGSSQDNPRTEPISKVITNACHYCGKVGHFRGNIHPRMQNFTETPKQGKQQIRKVALGKTIKTVEPSGTLSVEESTASIDRELRVQSNRIKC